MIDPRHLSAFARPVTLELSSDAMDMAAEFAEVDKFGKLRPALGEHAGAIEECCDEISPDALRDSGCKMDLVDIEILQQGIATLDPNLRQLLQSAAGISSTEAADIGMHLESEGHTQDGDRFAGWLYRGGQHVLVPAPSAEMPTEPAEAASST